MNARFLRSLLILAGTYWVAEWLAPMIMAGEAALGIGYSGVGRLGERPSCDTATSCGCWWYDAPLASFGIRSTRRWMWALAALFAAIGLVDRQLHPAAAPDPVSRGAVHRPVREVVYVLHAFDRRFRRGTRRPPERPDRAPSIASPSARYRRTARYREHCPCPPWPPQESSENRALRTEEVAVRHPDGQTGCRSCRRTVENG